MCKFSYTSLQDSLGENMILAIELASEYSQQSSTSDCINYKFSSK